MPPLKSSRDASDRAISQLIRFTTPTSCSYLEAGESADITWTMSHYGQHLPPVSLYLAYPGCPHLNEGYELIG
jgi:hypothetical protein